MKLNFIIATSTPCLPCSGTKNPRPHTMYALSTKHSQSQASACVPNDDTLKVKLADSDLHAGCRIFLGTNKRASITTNWSEFRNLAKIYEGDICAFRFEVTTKRHLVLIVHRL